MRKYTYTSKTKEEAIEEAKKELGLEEKNLYITEKEIKNGLFKSKKVEIEVITKKDIITEIKSFLTRIIHLMGIEVNFEVKERNENILITAFCENNNILIGKQGRTLNALSLILKQYLYNELGFNFNFVLDAGEYKQKNEKRLERLAKTIAREVGKTKIETKLDPMNSYERRIIHTFLSDNKYVKTESIGEEPNRCIVIKPKEDN